ncbi:MAG: TrmB family transcriptional regulator [Nanobdellota archaeon]
MKFKKELRELNLDDNEIKVYLACLELGSSKVHDIAKKSELIRTTTYGVLKSLIEKGFVSTITKDNVTHFQAVEPKKITEMLDEKKNRINSIIPELEKIKKSVPVRQSTESFEGKKGLKSVFNDLISESNKEIKIIGSVKKWLEFSDTFTDIYFRKKKERNVKAKVLINEKEKENTKNKKIVNSEYRYLENLDTNSEIFIYSDKVAFISFDEKNLKGTIIQNKEINKLQSDLFDRLWKKAEK